MNHGQSRLHVLVAVLALFVAGMGLMPTASAAETKAQKLIVAIGPKSKQALLEAFSEFGVTSSLYPNEAADDGAEAFVADMQKASVLMMFHGGGKRLKELMMTPKVVTELKAFLARGGVIYCGYKAAGNGNGFLKPLGATPLARIDKMKLGYFAAIPASPESTLKDIPEAYPFRCYGVWTAAPAKIKPLLVLEKDKDASPLLMEEGVQGKGRIVYSQLLTFLQWTKGPRYKPRHQKKVALLMDLMLKP
jgi:hypothetical protein